MAITFGTPVKDGTASGGGTSVTEAVTVPTGCTHLVVGIAWTDNPLDAVSSVVFNGTEAGAVVSGALANDTFGACTIWVIPNPSATTANLVVTWAGTVRGGFIAVPVLGAQPNVAGVNAAVHANSVVLANVSAPDAGVVIDVSFANDGDNTALDIGADQTLLESHLAAATAGGTSVRLAMSYEVGTGNRTLSWTRNGGTSTRYCSSAICLRPVGDEVLTQPADPTDASGETAITYASGVPGVKALTATILGVEVTTPAIVEVVQPE